MLRLPCHGLQARRFTVLLRRTALTRAYSQPHSTKDAGDIRNMALVAHIDSGKTTLTESILLKSSYLFSPGTVDTGSTTTDFLPAERERGITIQSASIPVQWKNWSFNLVDTPGHADFGMEVESASSVVDGAVVLIDSVEGVEAQTKGVWQQLDRYGVRTRMMFLNKLDRPGASFRASFLSLLNHRLHPKPLALTIPVASFSVEDYKRAEPGIHGLVDLVHWVLWKWNPDGEVSQHRLPDDAGEFRQSKIFPEGHPLVPELLSARTALLDALSMTSDEFMETLLESSSDEGYLKIDAPKVLPHLRRATIDNQILPVLCGSAAKHIGTELVLNYVGDLFASPSDIVAIPQIKSPPLRLLAWKVAWDPKKGWMTFVRVYSGKLTRHNALLNTTRNQKERAAKLLLLYASEAVEVEELPFGSIGVILGLKHTRTGDTLTSQGGPVLSENLHSITPPPAVISASIIPQSHADLQHVQDSLTSLVRTDPSVRVDVQEGQILVRGLGVLHLEIVGGRLRDEWNARFEFGSQRVSYREALGSGLVDEGCGSWRTEVGGKSVDIRVQLSVRSLVEGENGDPAWDGNLVVNQSGKPFPAPDSLSNTPESYIARGIANTLASSPHTSLALTNVFVQVQGYTSSSTVPPATLAGAGASIMRKHITELGRGPIMEPYVNIKVTVGEDSLGKVVKDLTEHGGEILDLASSGMEVDEVGGYSTEGFYVPPAWISPSGFDHSGSSGALRVRRSVHAVAPLSKMLDYSPRLRALSGGHGQFELANAGFKDVSDVRALEILQEIGKA
ncbi:P-loop containing nucleoside triphosphate hydrolase protein [Pluteus cervinus]|uniref:P-loop containing nucleoside triphosphate hydrolase protein n=1 Tax=Pluteus cervinus TaxID=181527 RepID=A0ACD3BD97_9AGAR|nr:P-loop containing nucleoside triphosphate hydrolase protein [Pluteus cervinus]